jgi:DNA modification methylase
LIVDCFGGNGTTLMACLALDKRSATIEIYPAYCSVIIQRWVDATGGVPELMS